MPVLMPAPMAVGGPVRETASAVSAAAHGQARGCGSAVSAPQNDSCGEPPGLSCDVMDTIR